MPPWIWAPSGWSGLWPANNGLLCKKLTPSGVSFFISGSHSLSAGMVLAMIMAGVTQPTIMDTRCCSAMETAMPAGGMPLSRNRASRLALTFRMEILLGTVGQQEYIPIKNQLSIYSKKDPNPWSRPYGITWPIKTARKCAHHPKYQCFLPPDAWEGRAWS